MASKTEAHDHKKKTFIIDLSHDKEHYVKYPKRASRILYTMFLLILTICNFLIFLALVPLMVIVKSAAIIPIFAGIGLVFGLVYLYLVIDIEHLRPRHHVFAALYIPLISLINIIALITIGRTVQGPEDYGSKTLMLASVIYVALFLIPYSIYSIVVWAKTKRKAKRSTIRGR